MDFTNHANRIKQLNLEFAKRKELRNLYAPLYPEGVDLTPGTTLHDKLVSEVLERADESSGYMSNLHSRWEWIDKNCTAFIDLDAVEEARKDRDSRKPVSIVVPELYATRETLLTYAMQTFGVDPMFKYYGSGPEDTVGSVLMERLISAQMKRGRALLALHTQFSDGFTYGFGAASIAWDVKTGRRSRIVMDEFGIPTRTYENTVLFEGSVINPIDPYYYLPDIHSGVVNPDKGGFVGWREDDIYDNLMIDEADNGSLYINVRYLEGLDTTTAIYCADATGRNFHTGIYLEGTSSNYTQKVHKVWMYRKIIPFDYGLGESKTPEVWLFCVAGDAVLICCQPFGLGYNEFPVTVCAPDHYGHEMVPVSRLEVASGYQNLMNFYQNTAVANILQGMNLMLVVDPKIINVNDLRTPSPGKIVRTRMPMWGQGVKGAIESVPIPDVTSTHMTNLMAAQQMSRTASGAVDAVQGVQRQGGERVTSGEFNATRGAALSRLQKSALMCSLQAMYPAALIYAYNTQELMSLDTYVKVMGHQEEVLRKEYGWDNEMIQVSPMDLEITFDVEVSDGSVISAQDPNIWNNLLSVVSTNPEVFAAVDSTRVFLHIARLMGEKNAHDFLKKGPLPVAEVVPNGETEGMTPVEEME